MNIRTATASDLEDLVRLNDQIQHQHADQYPDEFKYPANKEEVKAFFIHLLNDDASTILVASENGSVFGYLYYEIQLSSASAFKFAKTRCYIHHVVVDSSVRRSGTASALFDKVEKSAVKDGIKNIALDSWMLNKEAHRFFEGRGFEATRLVFSKNVG